MPKTGVFQSFFNLTMITFLNMSWYIIISNKSVTCGPMDGYGSSNNPQILLTLTEYTIYQKAFIMANIRHGGISQSILDNFGSPCR